MNAIDPCSQQFERAAFDDQKDSAYFLESRSVGNARVEVESYELPYFFKHPSKAFEENLHSAANPALDASYLYEQADPHPDIHPRDDPEDGVRYPSVRSHFGTEQRGQTSQTAQQDAAMAFNVFPGSYPAFEGLSFVD